MQGTYTMNSASSELQIWTQVVQSYQKNLSTTLPLSYCLTWTLAVIYIHWMRGWGLLCIRGTLHMFPRKTSSSSVKWKTACTLLKILNESSKPTSPQVHGQRMHMQTSALVFPPRFRGTMLMWLDAWLWMTQDLIPNTGEYLTSHPYTPESDAPKASFFSGNRFSSFIFRYPCSQRKQSGVQLISLQLCAWLL